MIERERQKEGFVILKKGVGKGNSETALKAVNFVNPNVDWIPCGQELDNIVSLIFFK